MCSYDSFDTFFKEKNDDSFDAPRVGSNAPKHPLLLDTASSDDQLPSKRFCRKGTRVVCKARGLSKKHNANTAYFDIPGNASHGLLLTCSHPECVASGRKFRFCQVCHLPVAKRNFLVRHGHDLLHTSKELNEKVDSVYGAPLDHEQKCQPCEEYSTFLPETKVKKPRDRRVVSFDAKRRLDAKQLGANERAWLLLLRQRPGIENQSKMSQWMDKIMKFSDQKRATMKEPSLTTVADPLFATLLFDEVDISDFFEGGGLQKQTYDFELGIEIDELSYAT